MGDRTDIDALLIGALYGELTPADEARLAAHLESHPADRTALADLSRTRDAVRSSRVLSVQAEPPQAVSALLIQEAARRMPRGAREPGWFYRITRVLFAHPALAVAAMFVIVLGVTGTMRMRRGDQFAEPAAPAAPAVTLSTPTDESALRTRADFPEPGAMMPARGGAPAQEPTGEPTGASAGSAGLAAQPSQPAPEPSAAPAAPAVPVSPPSGSLDGLTEAKRLRQQDAAAQAVRDEAPAREELVSSEHARAQKPSPKAGIVLRRPDPMPKDFEERIVPAKDSKAADTYAEGRLARGPESAAGAGGAAAPPRTAAAPAVTPQTTPARQVRPGAASGASADDDTESLAKNKLPARQGSVGKLTQDAAVAPPAAAPPPPPPAPEAQGKREDRRFAEKPAAPAEGKPDDRASDKADKAGEDRALLGWARKQHEQVIAAVKSSKCDEAASLATEIYRRAPAFYAENLATARTVKPCASYLNREREREDRNRAASKRAYSNEAPAPAPAPTKK
jgi:hypothetical protein